MQAQLLLPHVISLKRQYGFSNLGPISLRQMRVELCAVHSLMELKDLSLAATRKAISMPGTSVSSSEVAITTAGTNIQ